ncbi:hypothetical protein COW99_01755 [Candidatus Roizmanbacteria bacterium CG22_combo_CG10-13_8_21_14_all_38_20]|uniref:Uncharacterized protein n=1 Tax=Candidatus Roizmanbacteria bacterium CG22_combo_CG10-13_8_21_14_all_38_20 TaxID=1974862 RepID=A0A2H0BY22_9BACT|nr:hypothetical protein [Candidatus Microgenomates bacterium]PIP61930.1 MAG: hypothetical protein COW99_01755 [Candidatus Roizmanbacteria bacterium CG22_combo_CG10-13_8_21_14_all_38_20]PJC32095.1 MAG: hypothetical protein CO050_01200 [Candidatus Roizmanbacteria bacterium CG_4_9_14_0_2_um_filter_38_17]
MIKNLINRVSEASTKMDLKFGYTLMIVLVVIAVLSKVPYANLFIKIDIMTMIPLVILGVFFRLLVGASLWLIIPVLFLLILISSISEAVITYTSFIYGLYLIIISLLSVTYMLYLLIFFSALLLIDTVFGVGFSEILGVFLYISLVGVIVKYSYQEMIQSNK